MGRRARAPRGHDVNAMGAELARGGNTNAAEHCFTKAREAYERSRSISDAAMHGEHLSADDLQRQSA